jgi:phosphohistidine swiveling domain-containing protein
VKIVAKHDHSIVYDWSFDLALLHMRGRNLMTVYPATAAQPDAASRITIDNQEGDLGRGRTLFRVHPRGENSLLVVSLRLDLREANFVARQVAKAARSVNRSANLALAFSMALHVRNEAEKQAGVAPVKTAAQSLQKPVYEVGRLAPLLNRGDLLLFRTRGEALDQVAVVGAVAHDRAKVESVMHDAKAFGSSLVPGSKAEVTSVKDGVTAFDWEIALPLVGVSGEMKMRDDGPTLTIDATKGALSGGRWLFDLNAVTPEATLVTGWARFDFDHSTWLLEKLISADAYLGQGIIGASQVMLLRAIRSRAAKP